LPQPPPSEQALCRVDRAALLRGRVGRPEGAALVAIGVAFAIVQALH